MCFCCSCCCQLGFCASAATLSNRLAVSHHKNLASELNMVAISYNLQIVKQGQVASEHRTRSCQSLELSALGSHATVADLKSSVGESLGERLVVRAILQQHLHCNSKLECLVALQLAHDVPVCTLFVPSGPSIHLICNQISLFAFIRHGVRPKLLTLCLLAAVSGLCAVLAGCPAAV